MKDYNNCNKLNALLENAIYARLKASVEIFKNA